MKRYIILTFLLGLFAFSATAQNVLFSDDAETAYEIPKKGKNRASFAHIYTGYRIAPDYFTLEPQVWNGEFFVGRRTKYALTRNYAMGWELEYLHTAVSWDNANGISIGEKESADGIKHRYVSHAVSLGYYNRITFGKVGNNIGKFLDIGVYGAWNFGKNSTFLIESSDGNEITEVTKKNPDFDDAFFYGVKARLGIHRVAITADYRFVTPDFSSINDPDINMPMLTVGLELSLYKPKI